MQRDASRIQCKRIPGRSYDTLSRSLGTRPFRIVSAFCYEDRNMAGSLFAAVKEKGDFEN